AVAGDDRQRHLQPLRVAQLLHEDVDLAATREADAERHLVRDPVGDQPRLASAEYLLRGEDDVALHAAAGDGARELALLAHCELRADGPGSRAARRDDRRYRNAVAVLAPARGPLHDLLHRDQCI